MMTRATPFRAVLLAIVLPALAGCSALSALGDATEPLAAYELRPPFDLPVATGRPRALEVIVELPTTGGALETDRILIRPSPLEAQYLPDVRWSEPAPVMIQTLMLRSLDATRAFQYVGRQPLGAGGDYAIVTELVDFEAQLDAGGDSARVAVGMIVRIVREDGVRIVASQSFAASEAAASLDDAVLIEAFDVASGRMIAEAVIWILANLGAG